MVIIIDNKSEVTFGSPTASSSNPDTFSEPPPYSPPQRSDTDTSTTEEDYLFPDLKSTNHVEVHQTMSPIGGKWRIDTSLQVPNYDGRSSKDQLMKRPNVSLRTTLGTISASIELVRGTERARIDAVSYIGTVSLRVSNPKHQPIDINCQTTTGTISVYLPRNFRGPFTLRSDVGSKGFSKAVDSNMAIFSKHGSTTRGFIGEYEGTGYGEAGKEWTGDQLVLQSNVGAIDVRYLDEWKMGILYSAVGKSIPGLSDLSMPSGSPLQALGIPNKLRSGISNYLNPETPGSGNVGNANSAHA